MKKYQLPKEFAIKWVKALRSGRFTQGRSNLYNNKKYCCLGVACEIVGIKKTDMKHKEFISDIDEIGDIPTMLLGNRFNNSLIKQLTDMNDSLLVITNEHKYGFSEIASWIEHNVEFV